MRSQLIGTGRTQLLQMGFPVQPGDGRKLPGLWQYDSGHWGWLLLHTNQRICEGSISFENHSSLPPLDTAAHDVPRDIDTPRAKSMTWHDVTPRANTIKEQLHDLFGDGEATEGGEDTGVRCQEIQGDGKEEERVRDSSSHPHEEFRDCEIAPSIQERILKAQSEFERRRSRSPVQVPKQRSLSPQRSARPIPTRESLAPELDEALPHSDMDADCKKWTYKELRAKLKHHGLKSKGKKSELLHCWDLLQRC